MDEHWNADLVVAKNNFGLFTATLVFTPPAALGPPVQIPVEGEYERPELAEIAALDAFAAMTRSD